MKLKTRLIAHFKRIFSEVDFIVTPATAITAPIIHSDTLSVGERDRSVAGDLGLYTSPGNFAGNPGISVPIGHDSSGELPPIGHVVLGTYPECLGRA